MAENIFRLKRIAKNDPFITPVTAIEKHMANGGSGGGDSGGSGGVSSYYDLTDAPVNIVQQPSYSQDDAIAGSSGQFGAWQFVKVSDDAYALTDLMGAKIVADGTEYTVDATNTFDITTTMNQVGGIGSSWVAMSPSGDWMESLDVAVMSCDGTINFDMDGMAIIFTPGTWIRQDVTSVALPAKMEVSEEFEQVFVPLVTSADNRKKLMVIDGAWSMTAQSSLTGINDYRNIQRMVANGSAQNVLPVWAQIRVPHKEFGEIVFDVVDHATENGAHSMTLLMNDLRDGFEFDATEALCVCPSGLAAGSYSSNNYAFTLAQAVPANGVLVIGLNGQYQPETISSYASVSSLEAIETVALTGASGGETALDTVLDAGDINNFSRAQYGSGNYAQSGIHKYLTATGSDWWTPSHKFDRPPSYVNKEGFMSGFDQAFLDILAITTQTSATNQQFEIDYETNSSYTTSGKFFLPSYTQYSGDKNNDVDEGTVFGAFEGLGYQPTPYRIKYLNGQPWYYWERSCYPWIPEDAGYVCYDGYAHSNGYAVYRLIGFAAACVIQ